MRMIEIDVTEETRISAHRRFDKYMRKVNWNRDFETVQFGYDTNRIYHGLLGEEIIRDYHDCDTKDGHSYQYDLVIKGYKVEVKTIVTKVKPHPTYLCLVMHGGEKGEIVSHALQDADYYMFVRILDNLKKAWLVGYMKCDEFIERSVFFEKGATYRDGKNFKITFDDSAVNVLPIHDMIPFKNRNLGRQLKFA